MAVSTISGSSKGGRIINNTITGSSKGGDLRRTIAPRTEEVDSTGSGSGKSGSGSGSGLSGSGSASGSYESSLSGGYGGGSGIDISGLIEAQRQAALNAYNNSMSRLDDTYGRSLGRLEEAWGTNTDTLKTNLNSTLDRLKGQYDYSSGVVNDDANKSLREAYVNYMLNKKNLAQGLSAMGLSGGATESNMAKMYNNYGSSRNNINTQLARNIANLLNEYQGNVSNANQLYNSQYADALNQRAAQLNNLETQRDAYIFNLEQNLASALTNLNSGNNLAQYANYANTMANLNPTFSTPTFSSGNYSSQLSNINNEGNYMPTENTLALNSVSTTAANNMGSVTDYAKWKAMADSLSQSGAKAQDIIYYLRQNGAPLDAVTSLLGA